MADQPSFFDDYDGNEVASMAEALDLWRHARMEAAELRDRIERALAVLLDGCRVECPEVVKAVYILEEAR